MHERRFPGETDDYRAARNRVLEAEVALRRSTEAVAAARRALPAGGPVPEDYEFELAGDGEPASVRLSELFGPEKDTLVVYNFMYGPAMARPCPSCTSILDSLDGSAPHITQQVNLAVIAKSPPARIADFARERGWQNLRLLSSAGNTYNLDYFGEDADGNQWPMLNVFQRNGDETHHFWGSELLLGSSDEGQDNRHVDFMWPLWNVIDVTPDGRGADWNPALSYPTA
ncbi:MAG: DUF899 family protein [Acidimicrobiia bacterium]